MISLPEAGAVIQAATVYAVKMRIPNASSTDLESVLRALGEACAKLAAELEPPTTNNGNRIDGTIRGAGGGELAVIVGRGTAFYPPVGAPCIVTWQWPET